MNQATTILTRAEHQRRWLGRVFWVNQQQWHHRGAPHGVGQLVDRHHQHTHCGWRFRDIHGNHFGNFLPIGVYQNPRVGKLQLRQSNPALLVRDEA
jgi:hypothetical protein